MKFQEESKLWSIVRDLAKRPDILTDCLLVVTLTLTLDSLCILVVRVIGYRSRDVLCFLRCTNWIYICHVEESRPPLWSSGQSSWLHNGYVVCFLCSTNWIYICYAEESRPPLLSSGQCSWLQIQRSGFVSRHYQIFWEGVGLERGPTQPREYNWGATWKKK
jgi:hypothetical protein